MELRQTRIITCTQWRGAAERVPLNSGDEQFFHHGAFEILIADLHDLMFDHRKADSGKGRLRRQAGAPDTTLTKPTNKAP